MNNITRKCIAVGLAAAIGYAALPAGQAPGLRTASAATTYETEVTWGVNLRAAASLSGRVIDFLQRGENVSVIAQANAYWLKVRTRDGKTGYISANAKYTDYRASGAGGTETAGSKADRVVALAESYMGRVSYDFGTRNPSRLIFDCSSFTEFIFAKVGVDLKWGTRYQKSQGAYVGKSGLRKGDLVFFDTSGSNNGNINHVGIYMGGGRFIHNTPSKDGIAINDLNAGYWKTHYVTARRVL